MFVCLLQGAGREIIVATYFLNDKVIPVLVLWKQNLKIWILPIILLSSQRLLSLSLSFGI